MNRAITYILLVLLTFATPLLSSAQKQMRIQGVVTASDTRQPIRRAVITCDLILKGYTDDDGHYSVVVDRGSQLCFNAPEYEAKSISVGVRQEVDIVMNKQVVSIDAIVVRNPFKASNNVIIDPTDVEVVGNYFKLKTNIHIPYKYTATDCRFVMQPSLYDVTQDKHYNLRPVVMDGKHYSIIEHRHLNFGKTKDVLEDYIVENRINKNNSIYTYRDSIYVGGGNLENDYKVYCQLVVASYHEPALYLDTLTIAHGTINPLRFLDVDIAPLSLDESTLPIPPPDFELHNMTGIAKIEFQMAKSNLDYNNENNVNSIESIKQILKEVQNNPNASLLGIRLKGYTSPEGGFITNTTLANRRTETVLKLITSDMDIYDLEQVKLDYQGIVEPWDRIADFAEADSLSVAPRIRSITSRSNYDRPSIQHLILRLPEYKTIIKPNYLPRLRRVEYSIDYSVFRSLTFAEIERKYYYTKERLTRSEYFTLISGEVDSLRKVEYERSAIQEYPTFMRYVNREVVRLIESGSVNLDLLLPMMDRDDLPQEVIYNQAAMQLMSRNYSEALELVARLDPTPETEYIINVERLYQGDYNGAAPYFEKYGGLNHILILLCQKQDREAHDKLKKMLEQPEYRFNSRYNYVMAICANRMEDLSMAMIYLQVALELEPSLAETAKIDGDIIDIYQLIAMSLNMEDKA